MEALHRLLRSIPPKWSEFDPDSLTDAETKLLYQLVAAGLVEQRYKVSQRFAGQPGSIVATITATGEYGAVEAAGKITPLAWSKWSDAYREWKSGEAAESSPFVSQLEPGNQWRLTDQGEDALREIDQGEGIIVDDFVLRRGFMQWRPPVRGAGIAERIEEHESAATADVKVTNWSEGAAAIAAAFAERADNDQDEPDGPCGVNQWRHNGVIVDGGMTPKPAKLAAYLYARLGRKVPISDLNGSNGIWDGGVSDGTIQKHGKAVALFFATRRPPVPLDVSSGDGCIWMKKIAAEE